jgi:hypothetical protein
MFGHNRVQKNSIKIYQVGVSCVQIDAAKATLYFERNEIPICTFHIYCTIRIKFRITDLNKIFALFPVVIAQFG